MRAQRRRRRLPRMCTLQCRPSPPSPQPRLPRPWPERMQSPGELAADFDDSFCCRALWLAVYLMQVHAGRLHGDPAQPGCSLRFC